MVRMRHGEVQTTQSVSRARADLAASATETAALTLAGPIDLQDFDFLFPSLQQDSDNLLPESVDTLIRLKVLGRSVEDDIAFPAGDSNIPAAYTYFGQLTDHEVTFEVQPEDLPPSQSATQEALLDDEMVPLSVGEIQNALRNSRTATLELDSIYNLPAPLDPTNGAKMRIGSVTPLGGTRPPTAPVPGKGPDNDLPRERPSSDLLHDRAALIGDPRNDENLIVAQLHLAFLKAHNELVDQGRTFEEARTILRQHYQHLVIHDFLRRIADNTIVDDILRNGNSLFNPLAEPFFMPLEFAVAAFRFGHTMVRGAYNFNSNFNFRRPPEPGEDPNQIRGATLERLFTFTALSGELGVGQGSRTLPENWVIQWENIIDAGPKRPFDFDRARRIDTKLAGQRGDDTLPPQDRNAPRALFNLQTAEGVRDTRGGPDAARLAVRNLLRGYRLRIPTGQAVAQFLGEPVLTPDELRAAADSPAQVNALQNGGFLERTPLWYYLLAEAKHAGPVGGQGNRLGRVGSKIVAEVLIGSARRSADSILRLPGWAPALSGATPGRFELADLLRFAGVLELGAVPPRLYTVQPGDTLFGIAQQELGNGARFHEIFALNRGIIRNPDLIFPKQVLFLPGDAPIQPTPRFHIVRQGQTLSSIAQQELGDASRASEIFALNRDVISNPNLIFPGQVLLLPT